MSFTDALVGKELSYRGRIVKVLDAWTASGDGVHAKVEYIDDPPDDISPKKGDVEEEVAWSDLHSE